MDSIYIRKTLTNNDCILVFSARDKEKGKFTFWSVLDEIDINIIFINDYSNGWYLKGTPEFDSHDDFLDFLKHSISDIIKDNGKLYTLGSSMGAYAALKYGSFLDADSIIAMGPESELCIPYGRSVTSLKSYSEGNEDIANLKFINPERVYIFSGNNDIVDFYSACKFKHYNPLLSVNIINNRTHVVAKYLNASFGLKEIVESLFIKEDTSFLRYCERGQLTSFKIARDIKMFNEKHQSKFIDTTYKKEILETAEKIKEWSMIQYFAALICEKENRLEEAKQFLINSLLAQNNLGRSRLKLASLYFKAGNYIAAKKELQTLKAQQYTFSIGILYSKVLLELKEYLALDEEIQKLYLENLNQGQKKQLDAFISAYKK